jgi:hypothetical protein
MKAILRNKQVYWPHFMQGIYFVFFGGLVWLLNNNLGYAIIFYGFVAWSLAELLLGGDEIHKEGDQEEKEAK